MIGEFLPYLASPFLVVNHKHIFINNLLLSMSLHVPTGKILDLKINPNPDP